MSSNFQFALSRTLVNEGGYDDDPKDPGGETFRGITRRDHRTWAGWKIVDAAKATSEFPKGLVTNSDLSRLVAELYLDEYWIPMRLDDIDNVLIAAKLFDMEVQFGRGEAVQLLQRLINILNPQSDEITVDGKIGTQTIKAINDLVNHYGAEVILYGLRLFHGMRYAELLESNDALTPFSIGWIKRAFT